ncbi:phage portal protein [Glutamicibacter sp. PS]|uniref:phage portal protein n=1 Tax=Glutamicibacter sp. PS TaxID=3075634 RepID=UPI00284183D6|nr:phage portal protein [Glutamicibacter sp. PS]MDR4533221.1 phage portal protein [Glutamicibacter sp. PS]
MNREEAEKRVEQLARELESRQPDIEKHVDRYMGKAGTLKWASKKFDEYFRNRFAGFGDNWCMPVIDSAAERMRVLGIRPYDTESGVDTVLQRDWIASDSETGSAEAFILQMAAGRAYSLVHPAESPDKAPSVTWEHPSTAIVNTNPITGQDRDGLVMWRDDDWDFATYYTTEAMVQFKRRTDQQRYEQTGVMDKQGGWILVDEENPVKPHELGELPLTEIRNKALLSEEPFSDIAGVSALQDAVNLVWAYLMNALDQASLPARVVTGADVPKVPVLDKDGQVIGEQDVELDELMAEKIMFIPGTENIRVEEWTAANLETFSKVISQLVEHIAAQTRTPPHYLLAKMINTAAESLNIAEAGLVSKVRERIMYADRGIKKTFRLLAAARGASQDRLDSLRAGRLVWDNIQYRSEAQMADVGTKLKSAGFPQQHIVERLITDPAEVTRVMAMIEQERLSDPFAAAEQRMRQGI